MMAGYTINQVQEHQLESICKLFEKVGFRSFSESYVSLLYKLQPKGWLAATTQDGTILSVCLFWILDEKHARIAKFATDPEHQRRGIGSALFNAGLKYLGDRNIGLSANLPKVRMYKSFGFFESSQKIVYLKGKVVCSDIQSRIQNVRIESSELVELQKMLMYDLQVHIVDRKEFLENWISPKWSRTYVALNQQNDVVGYGSYWMCNNIHRIDPLYADDVDLAKLLLNKMVNHIPKDETLLVISHCGTDAMDMWKKVFEPQFESLDNIQMFTKYDVPVNTSKLYALCDTDGSFA